jgi:hypothetical protein
VESFSGFALSRDSQTVAPWIVPAVDPNSRHTNLACDGSGAIRFYVSPRWSSQSVASGHNPGAAVHLADLVASSASGTAVVWSLQVTADGNAVQLWDYTPTLPVVVLSAPIAWAARQFHNLVVDFGPQGTALFIDRQLVAQGGGTVPIPLSVGELVLGSAVDGTGAAKASVDEFFSFDRQLTAWDVATYYKFTGAFAAIGPITAEEDAARAALKSGNLAGQVADDPIYAAAHFLQESRTGSVAGFVLAAGPGAILSLHGATQDAQHSGGDGMADAAAVFSGADIQR